MISWSVTEDQVLNWRVIRNSFPAIGERTNMSQWILNAQEEDCNSQLIPPTPSNLEIFEANLPTKPSLQINLAWPVLGSEEAAIKINSKIQRITWASKREMDYLKASACREMVRAESVLKILPHTLVTNRLCRDNLRNLIFRNRQTCVSGCYEDTIDVEFVQKQGEFQIKF